MVVRSLCPELQAVAKKELNEDPKRTGADLKHIKEWLHKQPHINSRTDDQLLLSFLRGCKFSLERTKEKLDMYHTLKAITPELYENRDPFLPEIQKILSLGVMLPLPALPDPGSPRFNLVRNGLVDKHKLSNTDFFKVSTMIQDILLLEDDNLTVSGAVIVQDMSDLTMSYALSLSPSLVKKVMTCFQHGYPLRIKSLNFFNVSAVFETINSLSKPFMTEKLKQRIKLYSNREELAKAIPKEVLPDEYGGSGGKIEDIAAQWKAKIESYRDWFLDDVNYKTDEKKRPGKPKTTETVFGVEGSFRQLNLD